MKIIANIIEVIVALALVVVLIGMVWFMKWSNEYVDNMTIGQTADMYYHVDVRGDNLAGYMFDKFEDHVMEVIFMD